MMDIETRQGGKQRPARQVFAASSCTQSRMAISLCHYNRTEQNSKNCGTRVKKHRQLHYYSTTVIAETCVNMQAAHLIYKQVQRKQDLIH